MVPSHYLFKYNYIQSTYDIYFNTLNLALDLLVYKKYLNSDFFDVAIKYNGPSAL